MDNIPSLQNLTDIYGVGNPVAYRMAEQNLGLQDQFRQEALAQQQAATRKATLQNQFDEQNNPAKLEELTLKNTGTKTKNESDVLTLERQKANQQALIDEDKRKAILGATDFEIKRFGQQVEQMLYSPDPKIRAQGQQFREYLPAIMDMRDKHKQEMEKVNTQRASAERIAGGNNATQLKIAEMNNESRKAIADAKQQAAAKGKTIQDQVQAGKLTLEKAAVAFSTMAMFETDPEIKAKYEEAAQKYEEANQRARAAGAIGKADPDALGIETTKPQTVLGNKQAPQLPPGWKMK